jgi:hypothetical protein
MHTMYAGSWFSTPEPRSQQLNRFHRVALEEARMAAHRHSESSTWVGSSTLLDRVRRAVGIAPAEPECAVCAAA